MADVGGRVCVGGMKSGFIYLIVYLFTIASFNYCICIIVYNL